jgi:enamine deaminase RidA (YjgF/YER057c/UK114 family)
MSGFRHLVPRLIRAPLARYSHAVVVPASSRWLLCSGQLGISTDDQIPESIEAQAELCFESIGACLAEADMSFADVIKISAYVTERSAMPAYMAVRDRYVRLPPPASTLLIVSGFTRPELKVEVEAIAAKGVQLIPAQPPT